MDGRESTSDADRHRDLLDRSVASALADAVDRRLALARARHDRREGVRHREAQIIVAMRREHRLVGIGDARWPTFNVADMAVSVGAVLLAWVLWQEDRASVPPDVEPLVLAPVPAQNAVERGDLV